MDVYKTIEDVNKGVGKLNSQINDALRRFENYTWSVSVPPIVAPMTLQSRTIGVYGYNVNWIQEVLNRNIGNGAYIVNRANFDEIGSRYSLPYFDRGGWFYNDAKKATTVDYVDYIGKYYGTALFGAPSYPDALSRDLTRVVAKDYYNLERDSFIPNPNQSVDTRLGDVSAPIIASTFAARRNEEALNETYFFSISNVSKTSGRSISNSDYTNLMGGLSVENVGVENLSRDIVFPSMYNFGVGNIGLKETNLGEEDFPMNWKRIGFDGTNYKHRLFNNNGGVINVYGKFDVEEGREMTTPLDESGDGIRYNYSKYGNPNKAESHLFSYAEKEGEKNHTVEGDKEHGNLGGIRYDKVHSYESEINAVNDIIKKTNTAFKKGAYNTLVARFHTPNDGDPNDMTQSAYIKGYGFSHGRNLRKVEPTTENGYENPYCRVWTYHHQYDRIGRLIRPFTDGSDEDGISHEKLAEYIPTRKHSTTVEGGDNTNGKAMGKRLDTYSVLQSNGYIKITPHRDYGDTFKDFRNSLKKCMFSIENLAWKGNAQHLKVDQRGPFGGRIMWFPPYNLKFDENVSVNWNPTQFIGRGENIYTYTNTERSGNLSFTLLIDHPSWLDNFVGADDKTNGSGNGDFGKVNVDSDEQKILRFFAGCDLIKRDIVEKPNKEKEEPKIEPPVETEDPIDVPDPIGEPDLIFFIYYPNNYTGIDDINGNTGVDPIAYLLDGVGAQKEIAMDAKSITQEKDVPIGIDDVGKNKVGYETRRDKYLSLGFNSSSVDDNIKSEYWIYDGKNYVAQYNSVSKPTRRWYYRVDKRTSHEKLRGKEPSYKDSASFGFNSRIGYVYGEFLLENYGIKQKDLENFVSLADFFEGVTGNESLRADNLTDEGNVNLVKMVMNSSNIERITTRGFANSHGTVASNNKLSKDRGYVIQQWIKKHCKNLNDDVKFEALSDGQLEDTLQLDSEDQNKYLVNAEKAKAYRSAEVRIFLKKDDYVDAFKNESETKLDGDTPEQSGSGTTEDYPNNTVISNDNGKKEETEETVTTTNEIPEVTITSTNNVNLSESYNEARFFEKIKGSTLHHSIMQKIRYFDPAFHSITPEGFNARLTFLHQCTRQGHTFANSDSTNNDKEVLMYSSANNLAYGRSPVCILRIGDFYYTRIIIENISIDYAVSDGIQWDMNPEGIGVMPMLANVSMSFKFLGGSDLSGPIERLQNAISHNYYANTSVYDDNAEQVEYDEYGNIIKFKAFQ